MKKVVVISTASGNGKTTVGRGLAEKLDVPFHELDAFTTGRADARGLSGARRADRRVGGPG